MSEASNDTGWDHGLGIVDQVYGAGSSAMMAGLQASPFVAETVSHVFGQIWARPELSIRDKRLLVIGATAMLGRADLVAIQVAGAIVNGELTEAQLEEIPLLMLFYAGAGNATALYQGIQAAKAKAKDMQPA
jgi:4-carboxymuconolactone decarboxylase